MAFWSTIAYKIKEIIKNMVGARTIEQTLHVAPVISSEMEHAIQLWDEMYKGQAPWIKEPSYNDPARVVSLGLPALIASEKARTALLEFNSEITTPTEEVEVSNPEYEEPNAEADMGQVLPFNNTPPTITEDRPTSDTQRAEYLNEQYEKLKKQLRKQVEYGIAKGGLVIKPYVVMNPVSDDNDNETGTQATIEFDFIQADCFYPLSFDASGKITEAAFIQTKTEKDIIYRRLEYHKWENNKVQVVNKAFKSTTNQSRGEMSGIDLGQEVPLSDIPEWKDLAPDTTIANITRPLFAYFKMPEANIIDTTSPLGMSGYGRAKDLIKDADMQYSRLLWEYEAGEMAVNIDRDAFMWKTANSADGGGDDRGYSQLGSMQQRLYRQLDVGPEELFQPYSPALRDAAYLTGLNAILMRIEDVTGLSRGTLSDASAEARTATELKILKQRSYQTNADIQRSLEDCLRDVIYIMNTYCDLYEVTPDGEYDVNFEWDDSILVDVDTELGKRITMMQNGLVSKLENRMWYFGETERQAEEALRKIEEEDLQNIQNNIMMQQQMTEQEGPEQENKPIDKKGEE